MPYGRKMTAKAPRRKYRKQSLAKKAYTLAKKAYKLPELKYLDILGSFSSISGTGQIGRMDTVPQGTTNNTRIGDTIKPTSLKYRITMKLNAAATDTLVRMIFFRWVSEDPTNLSDVITPTIVGMKSEDLRYQSQIMYDRVFSLSTSQKTEIFLKGSLKIPKFISYPQASNASNRNSIYVGFVSDEAVNQPVITTQMRLFYRDS